MDAVGGESAPLRLLLLLLLADDVADGLLGDEAVRNQSANN